LADEGTVYLARNALIEKVAAAKELSAKAKQERVRVDKITFLYKDTIGMSERQLITHKFLYEEIRKKYGLL